MCVQKQFGAVVHFIPRLFLLRKSVKNSFGIADRVGNFQTTFSCNSYLVLAINTFEVGAPPLTSKIVWR